MVWEAAPGKYDNFGEAMIKHVFRHFNIEPLRPNPDSENDVLMSVSSEFAHTTDMARLYHKHFHIWGSANGHGPTAPYQGQCTAYSVRDVRTPVWNNLPNADTVLVADPIFCLPHFYEPKKRPNTGIVYAPHINNIQHVIVGSCTINAQGETGVNNLRQQLGTNHLFDVRVSLAESLENRYEILANAEFVFTNALHVLLFCFAYKVPVAFTLHPGAHYSYPLKWYALARTFGVNFGNHQSIQSGYTWWEQNIRDKEMPNAQVVYDSFPFQ